MWDVDFILEIYVVMWVQIFWQKALVTDMITDHQVAHIYYAVIKNYFKECYKALLQINL